AAPMRLPGVPVISNVTARPLTSIEEIRGDLVTQLTAPVQWVKSVEYIAARDVTLFIELGAKDVLTGLNKRIAPQAMAMAIGDKVTLEAFAKSFSQR
ncbi:MAG TPA: malonyl CoA-acyl carrier protein transacylase, partial [Anaerolineae bacterium]